MTDMHKEIDSLKVKSGYSGKAQQWQYGFDLACRELAKVIPEGFVLMPKEPTQELLNKMQDFFVGAFENGLTGGQSMRCAYIAMIEAQEQANEGE